MGAIKHSLVQAVREMLERNWDPIAIASKMKIDVEIIRQIIDLIT